MRQLTDEEHLVIKKLFDDRCGAFLQYAWIVCPKFVKRVSSGVRPLKTDLVDFVEMAEPHFRSFWFYYLFELPRASVNPVPLEQKAWQLLMPKVRKVLNEFEEILNAYESCDKDILLRSLKGLWDLIQKWNIISRSFKCKLEKMWDELEEREKEVEKLIEELSREKALSPSAE